MASEQVDAGHAMATAAADDLNAIMAVRDAFVAADNAGDAEAMARLLGDDIVILHPYRGVTDGKDAVRTFIGQVVGEVHAEFDKQATYSTFEVTVSGDLAYERGALRQLRVKVGWRRRAGRRRVSLDLRAARWELADRADCGHVHAGR